MPLSLGTWSRRFVDAFRSFRIPQTFSFRPARHLAELAIQPSRTPFPPGIPFGMTKSYGNFDQLQDIKLNYSDIAVSKWQSRITGLSVVHLDYEAPIVKGYFVVPTEIFNDSGCPHTLEHLVFMGSQKYPYKGSIDHFANRGFSNGTNAWTAEDHTCYTVSTAGEQGFLQLLPIYVDHILYPTITHSAYMTEVHHITPAGSDSGVVYSEMQGRENTAADLMALRTQRLIYPEGSGYRSETGGLTDALRVLSVDQIRKYHSEYYVPHNLTLIVAGKLAHGTHSLLDVIQNKIEPSLIEKGHNKGSRPPGWVRPILETSSGRRVPLQNQSETVEFPEKDESVGELLIAFKGPAAENFLDRKALDMVTTYLTASPVAPLNKEFIEIDKPFCTYIYFDEEVRPEFTNLLVYIGSVPSEHIESFNGKLEKSLRRIVNEGIDMKRMAMVINRDFRQLRSKLEASKGDTYSISVITDSVLGPADGSSLRAAMDEAKYYEELRQWTNEQWTSLLNKYLVEAPSVVVRGRPSAALANKLEKDEKSRVEAQIAQLGPEGLAKAKKALEDAKNENDEPIPEHVLQAFPVPDVSSIAWIPVQSTQDGRSASLRVNGVIKNDLARHVAADGQELPFFVEFDHVKSDFISVHAMLSLANLPNKLRPLVATYMSAFFSLPVVTSDGVRLSHEEVVAKLDDETVMYETELGIQGYFAESFRVSIRVEKELYEVAVRWLKDLIYGLEFDVERLQITCAKILQSLPELKRDGNTVLCAVHCELTYDESSTPRANAILAQTKALPDLVERLQEKPEEVQKEFEEIRRYITDPTGIRFSVTGNVLDVPNPREPWRKYFGCLLPDTVLKPIKLGNETLNNDGFNLRKKAIVVSLPSIESSFSMHTTRTVQGFQNSEYPVLRLALEVLNATESFLWRYIRGSGLAYNANVSCDLEAGLLTFSLYRTTDSMAGFREAAKVVEGLVRRSIPLEDSTIDGAKSALVYNIARAVSTPGSAATTSFVNQALKQVGQSYNRELLAKYQAITKDEVLAAMEKHVLPLFNPEKSIAVIVSAPGKVESTADELTKLGFEVEKREIEIDSDGMDTESDGSESSDSESCSDR